MHEGALRGLVLLALAAALACSDNSQKDTLATYGYAGCSTDGGNNADCPGEAAFVCAMSTIAAKHGRCASKDDCIAASGPDPRTCFSFCEHAPVNQNEEQAYLEEVKAEVNTYCSEMRCVASLNCPPPNNATIACVDGGCAWVEGFWNIPDGGK